MLPLSNCEPAASYPTQCSLSPLTVPVALKMGQLAAQKSLAARDMTEQKGSGSLAQCTLGQYRRLPRNVATLWRRKCPTLTRQMYQADQSGFSTHWDGIETWLTLSRKWLLIGLRDISACSWADRQENFMILWSFLLHVTNAKNASHHKSYGLLNLHWKNKHNWLKMHNILTHETWFIEY